MRLAAPYLDLLARFEPYVVSHRANWARFDLEPFGIAIPPHRRYEPTTLAACEVLEGLHRLDRLTFGDQAMLMPRWVIYDCAAFPGLTFGFGARARSLPPGLRALYGVRGEDTFVPLSMWMAIRCPEDDAWFGHNLSSANVVLGEAPFLGLATLTKALGLQVARARRQYGATQWGGASIGLHLGLGRDLRLLSTYTPAHTHPETLTYALEVDAARLQRRLSPEWSRPPRPEGARPYQVADRHALHGLQIEIEGGQDLRLAALEGKGPAQVAWITPGPALPA